MMVAMNGRNIHIMNLDSLYSASKKAGEKELAEDYYPVTYDDLRKQSKADRAKVLQSQDDYIKEDHWTDAVKRREPLGISYSDANDLIDYFDISKIPNPNNAAEPYLATILMSRPSLHLGSTKWVKYGGAVSSAGDIAEQSRANYDALIRNPQLAVWSHDPYGNRMLCNLSRYSTNNWLPIVTTSAMTYNVSDIAIKQIEKGNTYFGHVIKYGKHSEDHKISNTISIDFRNDRYLLVLKMCYLWMMYIYNVSKNGTIVPAKDYQRNGILDYAGSIYYLVTRRDNRELVYWEKLVGVFPINLPMSMFSYSNDMIIEQKSTIEFSYGIKNDPCDPSILMDINSLSGDSLSVIETKTTKGWNDLAKERSKRVLTNEVIATGMRSNPYAKSNVYATNPYVVMRNDGSSIRYYLVWEDRDHKTRN